MSLYISCLEGTNDIKLYTIMFGQNYTTMFLFDISIQVNNLSKYSKCNKSLN